MKKFFYLCVLLMAIHSCKEDCPEPNPCDVFPERFEIEMAVQQFWNCDPKGVEYAGFVPYDHDTITFGPRILLSLNYSYDSVKWQVGQDPRVIAQKSLNYNFNEGVGRVVITAVGFRQKSVDCFGEADDGVDTILRTIHVYDDKFIPILGTYRGLHEGQTDSVEITIGRDATKVNEPEFEYYLEGLPLPSSQRLYRWNFRLEWYRIYFLGANGKRGPDDLAMCFTEAKIDPDNHDKFTLTWRTMSERTKDITFKGRRIK